MFRPELVRPGAIMLQQASPTSQSMATSVIRISPSPASLPSHSHNVAWRVESPPPAPAPVPHSVVVSHNILQQALTSSEVSYCRKSEQPLSFDLINQKYINVDYFIDEVLFTK